MTVLPAGLRLAVEDEPLRRDRKFIDDALDAMNAPFFGDAAFAKEHGRDSSDLAALAGDGELHKALGVAVSRVNQVLAPVERVRRFVVANEAFTTANGQMTPTLKIKRHAIRAAYGAALLALYETKAVAS